LAHRSPYLSELTASEDAAGTSLLHTDASEGAGSGASGSGSAAAGAGAGGNGSGGLPTSAPGGAGIGGIPGNGGNGSPGVGAAGALFFLPFLRPTWFTPKPVDGSAVLNLTSRSGDEKQTFQRNNFRYAMTFAQPLRTKNVAPAS
jgi:hypothetical protein